MLTILSMIVGFLSSLAPEFVKLFQDSKDKKHELQLTKMQMESAEKGLSYKLEEIGVSAYSEMVVSAQKEQAATLEKASKWVVDLSGSVRPIITYLMIISYVGMKVCMFFALLNPSLPWRESMTGNEAFLQVWSEEDMAIFSGILAYWFGDRSLAKRR